jgi:phenylalanyl-tRNA synthetase beta chain
VLKAGDGLICDGEKPVALACVMGGLETEITDESESVFLE